MSIKTLVAALAATTLLAGGAAYAAPDQPSASSGGAGQTAAVPPGHGAMVQDFNKLSADGVRGYQDLTLARLAIFDGRIGDAKKLVTDADNAFNKAKSDDSVFTKAEADMRTRVKTGANQSASSGTNAGSGESSGTNTSNQTASNAGGSNANGAEGSEQAGSDVHSPIAWLPVDETVTLNEDYMAQPAKAKAVADANQSLAKGDRKGAMEKLRLAGVDLDVGVAVVPVQQTINDVNQAEQLINSGKYYEGSQKLRAVQDSTVITVADMSGMPATNGAQKGGANGDASGGQGTSSTSGQGSSNK